ncbi:MAG TPA: serpin family protein, partial [Pirellulaceae bacterium]|nr:serpin family protein [Pirellulaceae bacterium]
VVISGFVVGCFAMILAGVSVGCSRLSSGQDDLPAFRQPVINDQVRAAVRSQQEFGWNLYSMLADKPENTFYSPASIATALGMVTTGASGETRQQLVDALQISDDEIGFHRAMTELIQLLNTRDRGLQLRMVNRLWGQHDLVFSGDFLEGLLNQYYAPMGKADFKSDPEGVRQNINAWVAQQTADRIRNLFPSGTIDEDTRLVLANAIYFKADWKTPFNKNATKPAEFLCGNGESIKTDMMNRRGDILYAEDNWAKVVSLPYTSGGVSMVVVLPKTRGGLAELEQRISAEYLAGLLNGLSEREVRLAMPKFKFETMYVLNDVLQMLGMNRAFSDIAEFDRMTTQEPLKISIVVHKAFIDVNEEGTEAAAATGVGMKVAMAPLPKEPVDFVADHPFMFFIRHDSSGAVLFAGRLSQPESK